MTATTHDLQIFCPLVPAISTTSPCPLTFETTADLSSDERANTSHLLLATSYLVKLEVPGGINGIYFKFFVPEWIKEDEDSHTVGVQVCNLLSVIDGQLIKVCSVLKSQDFYLMLKILKWCWMCYLKEIRSSHR